jgi:hypothetical protein
MLAELRVVNTAIVLIALDKPYGMREYVVSTEE